MDKFLFIINPVAGGGRTKSLAPIIKESMEKHNISYNIIFTSKEREATRIVENSDHHKIIAVGGDGTVNEVAKGLINRGFGELGIIPSGTGNDLSRSLKIPLDHLEAIDIIIKGKTKDIDVGTINDYPFLNIGSFGFDAEVVNTTNKVKRYIKSHIAYLFGVLITLVRFRKKEVLLEIDGQVYKEKIVLLAAGNGSYYGGGMKILPNANLSDGYLHLCLVKDINKLFMLFLFPTIFKGNHIKYKKYVSIYKTKSIKIKTKNNIFFNVDGEILKGNSVLDFKISNNKLSIIYN